MMELRSFPTATDTHTPPTPQYLFCMDRNKLNISFEYLTVYNFFFWGIQMLTMKSRDDGCSVCLNVGAKQGDASLAAQ